MTISRPHLLVSQTPGHGARDLATLRESIMQQDSISLLGHVIAAAQAYLDEPVITPATANIPGRHETHHRHLNRDFHVVALAGHRVTTCALASLLTQDQRFVDAAMAQVDCLFDLNDWPDWRDKAHPWKPADLRTGALAYDLGLAYDWLHPMLTSAQRKAFVEGLDQRAIQPYFQSIEQGATWASPARKDNWVTCIMGGLGILGMALGEDHPESARLIELGNDRMASYMSIYGPQGEFNESPAYAGSSRVVAGYFLLLQCHDPSSKETYADVWDTLVKHCHWQMYLTRPPGLIACFGDAHLDSKPAADLFAAVASATRDPVLQWFLLKHLPSQNSRTLAPTLALWVDPTIASHSPQGVLPLGRNFPAYDGVVSSRTDWDPRSAACVVLGKAGKTRGGHGHHDAGQVCIDAHGLPLIVDFGSPQLYPFDYFGDQGKNYYNVGEISHNLLIIDQQHRTQNKEAVSQYLDAQFDDATGSKWSIDLSALHDNVKSVRRDVLHVLPGVIAVLDQVVCDDTQEHQFDLQWHPFGEVDVDLEVEADGSFVVVNGPVTLIARVVKLDQGRGELGHCVREHAYAPPFDTNRLGDKLPQKHEKYVQSTVRQAGGVALLSLFAVVSEGESYGQWEDAGAGCWRIKTGEAVHEVRITNRGYIYHFA